MTINVTPTTGPFQEPANFNVQKVFNTGETFVSWVFTDSSGAVQSWVDSSNPGFGAVGITEGTYTATVTYTDANGATQTDSTTLVVEPLPSHSGCPSDIVNLGTDVVLTAPTTLTGDVTYTHTVNGVVVSGTGASVTVNGSIGEVIVETEACTEGVDIDSKCETHPCAETSVVSDNLIGDLGDYHSYSKRPAFNCDETMLLLSGGGNTIYNVDTLAQVDSVPITSRSMWSSTDPNLIYGIIRDSNNDRTIFGSYDISTDTTTTLFDASAYYGQTGCEVTIGEAEGTIQNDSDVVLRVTCPSGIDELVLLSGSTVVNTISAPSWMDYTGVDLTSGYILVVSNGNGDQYAIYDMNFNFLYDETSATGVGVDTAHGDFVTLADGTTGFMFTSGSGDRFLNLADNSWTSVSSSGSGQARHISGLASANCPGLYLTTNTGAGLDSFLVQVDSNLNVEWEVNLGVLASSTDYLAQPKGSISPCGGYFVYASDKSGDARTYLVELDNSACDALVVGACENFKCTYEIAEFKEVCSLTHTINVVNGVKVIEFVNSGSQDTQVVIVEGTVTDDTFLVEAGDTYTIDHTYPLCYSYSCVDSIIVEPIYGWKVETEETVDFTGDNVVRDDENGFGYEWTLSNGTVCDAEFIYGVANAQPCRSADCGHTSNPYEDDYPNVNAYGLEDDAPCQVVPFQLNFGKAICGDIKISFFDIDENAPDDLNLDCGEIIFNVVPSASGVDGDLVETSSGFYTGQGTGNTNSNGDLVFTDLPSTTSITFDVQTAGKLSFGLGLSGSQTIKSEETGTHQGGVFYDSDGNVIVEPLNWVSV